MESILLSRILGERKEENKALGCDTQFAQRLIEGKRERESSSPCVYLPSKGERHYEGTKKGSIAVDNSQAPIRTLAVRREKSPLE